MKVKTAYKVLKTLQLLEAMPKVGESKIKLSDISFWSGVNRQTCWRTLTALEIIGAITRDVIEERNTVVNYWHTLPEALELLAGKEASE